MYISKEPNFLRVSDYKEAKKQVKQVNFYVTSVHSEEKEIDLKQ